MIIALLVLTRLGWFYSAFWGNGIDSFDELLFFAGKNGLVISMFLQLLLTGLMAFFLQRIANDSPLFPLQNQLVTFAFVLLSAISASFQVISMFSLLVALSIAIFYQLHLFNTGASEGKCMLAITIFTFLGGVLFFPFLLFWLATLLWLILAQNKAYKLLGIVTIGFIAMLQALVAFLYLINKLDFFSNYWLTIKTSLVAASDFFASNSTVHIITLAFVYVIAIIVLIARQHRNTLQQNAYLLFALIATSLVVIFAIVFFKLSIGIAILALMPLSLLVAYAFYYVNSNLASILSVLLIGITIAIQLRYL